MQKHFEGERSMESNSVNADPKYSEVLSYEIGTTYI